MLVRGIHRAKGNIEISLSDQDAQHPKIMWLKSIIDQKGVSEDEQADGCSFTTDQLHISVNGKEFKGDQIQSFMLALLTDPKMLNIQLLSEDHFTENEFLEVEIF